MSGKFDERSDSSGVSRRGLLRSAGAGGVALTASGVISTSGSAEAAGTRFDDDPVNVRRLSGDAVDAAARSVVDRPDIRNVLTGVPGFEATSLVEDAEEVFAAEHTLETGDEMTVVTFALGEDRVLAHFDARHTERTLQSAAKLFEVRGDPREGGTLVQVDTSVNGELVRQVERADDCYGCYSYGGEYPDKDCIHYDLGCLNSISGGLLCASACVISRAVCVACLVAALGIQAHQCCTNWVTDCITCSPGSP